MIKRYILHLEFHRGYRPIISFRREPRAGDRFENGGEMGTLVTCPTCSGMGTLHVPDEIKLPAGVIPNIMPLQCRCVNVADEFMPPNVRLGDEEARRRGLMQTKGCPVHDSEVDI